jgi:phthalate 4,5-cis-dihydrodiol dehydrogenase
MRKLRLGIVGLGRAFTLMRPTFIGSPEIEMVAAADPRPEARHQFVHEFHGTAYEDIDALVRDPSIDAVYIASPHQFHAAQTIAAAAARKHILVEKPMALNLAEARAMIAATKKAAVKLIVGHSHSFDAPIGMTHRIIESGEFGELKMIAALNFTDFLIRPRRPEELNTAEGGGVVFNQAAHQVDIVRLLAGGLAETVVAQTGIWDSARPTEGAYSAMIRFPGEVVANLVYSAYAHFDSDELADWVSELGLPKDPGSFLTARRMLPSGMTPDEERELRRRRGYGVAAAGESANETTQRWHEHFGFVVASCERADLRPTPQGVFVYSDRERSLRALQPPRIPRREVIEELCGAILDDAEPTHSGEWGMATLEACLAILQSSRSRRAIKLRHQIAVPRVRHPFL